MKSWKRILVSIAILLWAFFPPAAHAQQSTDPVYVVQDGDTLNIIAARFGTSMDALIKANNISNPKILSVGTELVIPGLKGVQGRLVTEVVPLGSNLISVSRNSQIPTETLNKLNRITSPMEIFAGVNLIIPKDENRPKLTGHTLLSSGQTALELAVLKNRNPWQLLTDNQLQSSSLALPGDTYFYPQTEGQQDTSDPPVPWLTQIKIDPLPLVQGGTIVIHITSPQPVQLSGTLAGHELHFFQLGQNEYVAMQGIHAMAQPGLSSLVLLGQLTDGAQMSFEQPLLLASANYGQDPTLTVDPATVDPANTKPEEEKITSLTAPITPERYWNYIFRQPVDEPACIKSWYGNRRSYNGGPYLSFHAGVDYGVCANLNIYAPAPGVVVFSGPLTVRGNATIIDHGWGVYTGYWHQTSTKVKVGDRVETGQLIGEIGGTGRVSGPHLHWEVWVDGVQVQPLDWLAKAYP